MTAKSFLHQIHSQLTTNVELKVDTEWLQVELPGLVNNCSKSRDLICHHKRTFLMFELIPKRELLGAAFCHQQPLSAVGVKQGEKAIWGTPSQLLTASAGWD